MERIEWESEYAPVKRTGHTPGSWLSDNSRKYYDSWLIRHNGIAIARMMQDTTRDASEHEANARLIAAAPELLEALREMVAAFGFAAHNGVTAKIMERAQAAIAKAEGRS